MTTNDTDHHNHDIDTWLDVSELLAPGNRNARSFPADAPIVHTTGPAGDLVLRRWEPAATASRIAFIANALDASHDQIGDTIPTIQPLPDHPDTRSVLVNGRLYTRSPYLPGRPLARYSGYRTPDGEPITLPLPESAAAPTLIADVARTIARVHQATAPIATRKDAPTATLASFMAAVRDVWFTQRKELGDHAAEQREIRRWLRCGNRIIPAGSDTLRASGPLLNERSVVLHGDLWPAHVLIEGREETRTITGLVGWTSAAAGSPVLDLAGLAVHMQGWSAALTEAVVESYAEVSPLAPAQRRLVPVVAAMDLVARVAWLLRLAYLDDRMIDHPAMPVLRSGLKSLLNSLETLTGIIAPDTNQARRWHRQGRPGVPGGFTSSAPARRPGAGPERQNRSKGERHDQ